MNMQDIYYASLKNDLTPKLGANMLRLTNVTANFECYNNKLGASELHITLKDNGGIKIEAVVVRYVRGELTKLVLGTVHTSQNGIIKAGRDLLGLGA